MENSCDIGGIDFFWYPKIIVPTLKKLEIGGILNINDITTVALKLLLRNVSVA